MELRIDLHLHTTLSQDSATFSEIPESILKDSGLIILPGIEIKAEGIHIGAFDIQELVEEQLSLGETVDRIHNQGGIAVICHAHSVLKTWTAKRKVEEAGFDLVEVANAYQFPYGMMVARNRSLAEKINRPQTGGSDSHIPQTVGRAYTVLEADEKSPEGVLDALRKGRCRGEGRGISLGERLKWPLIRI
jgi:predicted metal-dependent phosphoesterase TrpH